MRLVYLLAFLFPVAAHGQSSSGCGKHIRMENFASQWVASRNIDVWLPANYQPTNRYAVLYMHDGQMLFDSTATWNHQEWKVDETLQRLMLSDSIRNCIVVGVWNSGKSRHSDYFPQKPLESLPSSFIDSLYRIERSVGRPLFSEQVRSDAYLKFLVYELKPYIDSVFSVSHDRNNTFIAGSSMGGLISLYALCEYPEVFGGAACLSTHWPGTFSVNDNPIPAAFLRYLDHHLPSPKHHLLYFDRGTATLDSLYGPFQMQADSIVRAKGYSKKNFLSREFPGADHSERSWAARFSIPAVFLLSNRKKK